MSEIHKLEKIKKRLEQLKSSYDEMKAEKSFLLKKLKDEFGAKSVEEAEEMMEELQEELEEMRESIKLETEELVKSMRKNGLM